MPRPKPFRRPDGFRTTPRTDFERISGQPADRTVFEPSARTDSGLSSGPISGAFPKEFQTAIRRGFRPTVRTNPGPLPGGILRSSSRTDFRSPDGFRTAIRTNHDSDAPPPRKSHRKAGGIPGGATCGRKPYPNKRFSSAANLYPAFSTCASANSCEKMMKSRDSSYESV